MKKITFLFAASLMLFQSFQGEGIQGKRGPKERGVSSIREHVKKIFSSKKIPYFFFFKNVKRFRIGGGGSSNIKNKLGSRGQA